MRLGAVEARGIGQSFVFLLCDHPQISVELLQAIISRSGSIDVDIVGTKVDEEVVPPTLFKLNCVDDILNLEGDRGAKSVMQKHSVSYVEWADKGLMMDCDTDEDYEKLKIYYNCV